MKKRTLLMLIILAAAIAAAVYCLSQIDWQLPSAAATAADYSAAATQQALSAGSISENEILLTQTLEESSTGDVTVRFCIFSVAEGYEAGDFLSLSASEAEGRPGLTQVGTATASFIGGKTENIRNLKIIHTS